MSGSTHYQYGFPEIQWQKQKGLGRGFREDEKRVFIGIYHPNNSAVNGKYFSKKDQSSARKGADVSKQKYTIMLTFLSKLIKGKEAKPSPGTCVSFLFGEQNPRPYSSDRPQMKWLQLNK